MGISPRIVTEDVTFTWDGVTQRLPKGQIIDVAPDSPLERAIGAGRLVPLPGTAVQPPAPAVEVPAVETVKPAQAAAPPQEKPDPAKAAPPAKKQDDDGKDGDK
jgi:hypothetical protein